MGTATNIIDDSDGFTCLPHCFSRCARESTQIKWVANGTCWPRMISCSFAPAYGTSRPNSTAPIFHQVWIGMSWHTALMHGNRIPLVLHSWLKSGSEETMQDTMHGH